MATPAPALADLLAVGDVNAARETANRRLSSNPADAEALLALARLTLMDGDDVAAEQLVQRAEAAAGQSPSSRTVRGAILVDRDDHLGAITLLTGVLAQSPDLVDARVCLGVALASENELEESLPHFQRAVELSPTTGIYHYHLAQNLFRLERPEEAYPHAQRAPELAPFHAPAWQLLGNILSAMGLVHEARQVLAKGLEVLPGHPRLLGALTHVLLRGGDPAGALEVAGAVAANHPDDVEAQTNLALLLLMHRRYDDVIRISRGLSRRGPVSAELKCAEANALECKEPSDIPGAMRAYEEAMRMDNQTWVAPNNLGQLLLQETTLPPQRNLPRVLTLLEEAHRRAPRQPEPLLNLALAHVRIAENGRARTRANEVLALGLPQEHPCQQQATRLLAALPGA